ncbi:SMODS domain-containing nucleotidyltransferase [Cobetia marina]|uniref:SMODS domain-containing nucleotidyltransferase n=1 Tax=Cobetia marina TaxID=28258 RepID=UPI0025481270|nr:nucleotidyltransferase [Cobetia pacifica]MDI6002177.1 nucleotidyltransferase [Cobetia pacifica]
MINNIKSAFNKFRKECVDLDPDDVIEAREDREKLRIRIRGLATSLEEFPKLAPSRDIDFGSFSRKTKKKPLDDIDIFVCLHAQEATYTQISNDTFALESNEGGLSEFTSDISGYVSSIRLLNRFKAGVRSLYFYRATEISRNKEALVVDLNKDWKIDVVPCFCTDSDPMFYLIPDGSGNWKKANPKVDKNRVTDVNQKNNGNVLSIVRLVKYWNSRHTMPTVPSYLLECIVIDYYEKESTNSSVYVDLELEYIFYHIGEVISGPIKDPKGICDDLNSLSFEDRLRVKAKAWEDHSLALEANMLCFSSPSGTHHECINIWRIIFGDSFPKYGD